MTLNREKLTGTSWGIALCREARRGSLLRKPRRGWNECREKPSRRRCYCAPAPTPESSCPETGRAANRRGEVDRRAHPERCSESPVFFPRLLGGCRLRL